ncbi:MAG: hypothetical protein IJB52_12175 [Clostridia bacterium]|nr:hypothetical protein [Clostridia bacterium]
MKRTLICILAALMVSSTACSGNTAETETEPVNTEVMETEETETGRADVKDNLPEGLQFDGEQINVFIRPECALFDATGDNSGDVVFDAVYNRNLSVEERLGIKLNYILTEGNDFNFMAQQVYDSVMAGSDDYDILMQRGMQCFNQSLQGLYVDLADNNPYIDLKQPWWWEGTYKEGSIHEDKAYFLAGDITVSVFLFNTACFFNKDLMADYSYDVDTLYNTVTEGKWTYDVFEEYCTGVYQDVNGDGKASEDDVYAFHWLGWNSNYFVYSAGINYTERDAEGFPVLNLNTEKNIRYVEQINRLLHENNYANAIPSQDYLQMIDRFTENKGLFMMGRINVATGLYASNLRNMESPYGILPYPKHEEEDSYMSGTGAASGNLIAVPVTCQSFDATSAAIEAMCAENYRTVFPALYETALKTKYSDTNKDAQMIDIIHDCAVTDFTSMAGIGGLVGGLANSGSNDFASQYNATKEKEENMLKEMIETYKALGH